ncbi:MAG: hypothetical protein KIT11_10245 [Fimbriimonadaceae bacterium]|nr:hypothetical protein [Fimbriimonadaceae bacterium]QYK55701.1 MAG: hypothetical protein KF733_11915 [Fimbriimonadaceae bacterium]
MLFCVRSRGLDWPQETKDRPARLCLDPSDADHGPPARCFAWLEGGVRDWRLIGGLDPRSDPVALLEAAVELAGALPPDAIVLSFPVRETPFHRHLALSVARALRASRVIVPEGSPMARWPWPVGAEEVEMPDQYPVVVREAQRRARWLELFERSTLQEVDLGQVRVVGARLGSGERFRSPDFAGYLEKCGETLLVVDDADLDDGLVGRLCAQAGAGKLVHTKASEYEGLVCSFARESGEDFGMGVVRSFEPARNRMVVLCDAIAPAPVRALKLGTLRVWSDGREVSELVPWSV